MDNSRKHSLIQALSILVVLLIYTNFLTGNQKLQVRKPTLETVPTPTPFNPFPYELPEIPNSRSYRTMLVGDSMVAALGPNAQLLRQHLIELYPSHEFVNYNYGFGATNIETLPERLVNGTTYEGQYFPAILVQGFDLIIIESFAYNPLSQSKEGEGLSRHIQILDESIKQIIKTHPESAVAIMVTISPNKTFFAKGVYDLTNEERAKWVEERISYIEAVIKYTQEKEIPLINVYEKSLTAAGEGDLKYINHDDYIHPSSEGVDLIARTIAEFIYTNNIFPQ